MDPRFLIFLMAGCSLVVQSLLLLAAAFAGAWLYRSGLHRSNPLPQLPGRAKASPAGPEEEDKKPYHRKPPKP